MGPDLNCLNSFDYHYQYRMDNLTKEHKDEMATSFAVLALYDGGAEISSGQINALLEATNNMEVEAFYPIIFANLLSKPDKISSLITCPGGSSGGSGGAAGAGVAEDEQAEEKEEEKVEEEEIDMSGG